MFNFKLIVSVSFFVVLLTITSIIKNQTRIIEKKLYKLNAKINLKEKDFNESELDFYFLTSPSEIEKKIKKIININYEPIKSSKIFLNFSNFSDFQSKISDLYLKNEKKTKKN